MSFSIHPAAAPKILIIRRDNIGDLVCTTPLIRALRDKLPQAWLGALVNSYNAPVLDGNRDLNEVFVYTKAKHRDATESLIGIFWRRLQMMRRLRAMQLDDIIIATPAPQPRLVQLATWLKPKRIIGFGQTDGLTIALKIDTDGRHEVEDVFRIAALYGCEGVAPPCQVITTVSPAPTLTIGIHISARKLSQRWAAERFVEVMRLISSTRQVRFILLWSPGAEDNALHPGDDAKANAILEGVNESKVWLDAKPTQTLPDLIAALAECDLLICADGGAMHLAAGLSVPIVCLFGNSGAARWRPWGVAYQLLQKPSLTVEDITPAEVVTAVENLLTEITTARPTHGSL